MNVKVIADSTCDLSPEIIHSYEIDLVSLYTMMDGKSYRDGVDITSGELIKWCGDTGKIPTTSAASVADFADAFRPYAQQKRTVLAILISSDFSASVQNAKIAAQSFQDADIRVVDGRNLSTGTGLIVLTAAKMAAAGSTAEEIVKKVESIIPRVRASFIIDKLDFLYKGGRCSALAMFGANALRLKPQILVADGKMTTGEKFRGSTERAFEKYYEHVLEDIGSIDPEMVFITHSPSDKSLVDDAKRFVESMGYFKEIFVTEAGCVVTSHCGYNTIGILYIVKE